MNLHHADTQIHPNRSSFSSTVHCIHLFVLPEDLSQSSKKLVSLPHAGFKMWKYKRSDAFYFTKVEDTSENQPLNAQFFPKDEKHFFK